MKHLSAHWYVHWSGLLVTSALIAISGYRLTHRCPRMSALDAANQCMKNREYHQAKPLFAMAAKRGEVNQVSALTSFAECQIYLDELDGALQTATQLLHTPGGDGAGRLIRGWVYEKQGKRDDADKEYMQSDTDMAKKLLSRPRA